MFYVANQKLRSEVYLFSMFWITVPMLPDIMKTLYNPKESISSDEIGEVWWMNSSEVNQNSQMNYRKKQNVTSANSSS